MVRTINLLQQSSGPSDIFTLSVKWSVRVTCCTSQVILLICLLHQSSGPYMQLAAAVKWSSWHICCTSHVVLSSTCCSSYAKLTWNSLNQSFTASVKWSLNIKSYISHVALMYIQVAALDKWSLVRYIGCMTANLPWGTCQGLLVHCMYTVCELTGGIA